MAKTEKQVIESHDVLNVKSCQQEKYLTTAQHSKSCNDQKGLLYILHVAVDLIFILTVNLKMDDGLINGTLCILKYIQYLRPEFPNKPSTLWVLVDSKTIGKQWCHHNKSMYTSVSKRNGHLYGQQHITPYIDTLPYCKNSSHCFLPVQQLFIQVKALHLKKFVLIWI